LYQVIQVPKTQVQVPVTLIEYNPSTGAWIVGGDHWPTVRSVEFYSIETAKVFKR